MRILFLGDVMGRTGRTAVIERLPKLRAAWRLDFVVVNAENSASGMGLTADIHLRQRRMINVVTGFFEDKLRSLERMR